MILSHPTLRAAVFALAVLIPLHASRAAPETCDRNTLARILYKSDDRRTPDELATLTTYKNSPNPTPQTVDLGSSELKNPHPSLDRLRSKRAPQIGKRTEYEDRILHLRRGDTVVFDDQKFVLGEFLGAGNSTHVFAIAGSQQAIRIPFRSDFFLGSEGIIAPDPQAARMERILEPSVEFPKNVRSAKEAVLILHADKKGRFQIVERIEGKTTGLDLLSTVFGAPTPGAYEAPWTWTGTRFEQSAVTPSPEDTQRIDQLLSLMLRNNDASRFGSRIDVLRGAARQYLYDTKNKRWVLIDKD